MNTAYFEIRIKVSDEDTRAILMAHLEGMGFESFVEEEEELLGFIPEQAYDKEKTISALAAFHLEDAFRENVVEQKNWNEEWEKNYNPVVIAGKCYIRAPFHPEKNEFPVEIIIEPRMAFGTAHHETTALMVEWALETDFNSKEVLDMGCGTGVLAILANKLGASSVMAVDNDEWAYLNTMDNIILNDTGYCSAYYDDVNAIHGKSFDIIMANINRNILLQDIPEYALSLRPGGLMFLSGFYVDDVDMINQKARQHMLVPAGLKSNSNWAALCFRKE